MAENLPRRIRAFHYFAGNRIRSRENHLASPKEMVMHSLFRNSPSLPAVVPWLFDLATLFIARWLQMPEPLLRSAGVFVFAQAQAFEDSFSKSLCPIRLVRRVLARVRQAS
jgi:hypothetical protein